MNMQEMLLEINSLFKEYEDDMGVLIPSKIDKTKAVNDLVSISDEVSCQSKGEDMISQYLLDYLIIMVEEK